MAGCDCACHGHETKAEQPAPGPDASPIEQPSNAYDITCEGPAGGALYTDVTGPSKEACLAAAKQDYFNNYGSHPTHLSVGERTKESPRTESAAARNNGHNPNGGSAMTAPSGGNSGGDIMSVQAMRSFWEQAGTTAASASDPLQSAAAQLDSMAAQLEAVQAHAAEHGGETSAEAAAAAETYRQLAQKCHEAAAAVDPAMGGCANAHQGLERFRPAEEGLASLPNRHARTDAYVGS